MTSAFSARVLASGPGWRVSDIVCSAGPGDPTFEEQHEMACIAAVTAGTFQYRSSQGDAMFAPGALLLANEGTCFVCGHEHGKGDRCLAFHFAPSHLEGVAASMPGARRASFELPRLPPLPALLRLLGAAEAARDEGNASALEELAFRLPAATLATLDAVDPPARRPSARDERRITDALRRIETKADDLDDDDALSLAGLAREAAMSPYHFLRVFQEVVGMTPHQYVLHTRMHRAAVRLRRSDDPIAAIAYAAGFNDLSTFNRRFRRVIGESPSVYRLRRAA